MAEHCLACGKPLGGRTTLCYSCEQDGMTIEAVIDIDESIRDRVERFFVVSSIRCSDCGDVHGSVTVGGESFTAEDFGIESIEDWELEMEKEEEWLRTNESAVRSVLHVLEPEWPETVRAVRTEILR